MSIWERVKSFGWVKALVLGLGGALLGVAAARAQSKKDQAEKLEEKATNMLNSNSSAEIAKAKKMLDKAHKEKDKALEAKDTAEAQLNALGEKNESLDEIAHRFNSRRDRGRV